MLENGRNAIAGGFRIVGRARDACDARDTFVRNARKREGRIL